MSINTKQQHKSTDGPAINNLSNVEYAAETFPRTPIVHGVTIHLQLNDDNELYTELTERQQKLTTDCGHDADSDSPHCLVTDFSPSWDKRNRDVEIGFFSSLAGYGERKQDGGLDRCTEQHIQLYDNVTDADRAKLPAKLKLVVDKREFGLYTVHGNEFNWPPGHNGTHREGTHLKIQTSYVSHPQDAVNRAEEILQAAFDIELTEFGETIPETKRFSGVEAYIRYDCDRAEGVVQELKQSANLVVKGDAEGEESSRVKHGEYTLYGIQSTRFDYLGFDKPTDIQAEYLKTYADKKARQRHPDDPLTHWKLEARIHGGYRWEKWDDIVNRARRLVTSHARWAGIREDDLIADEWFLSTPETKDSHAYSHPTNRRKQLVEFWESETFKRSVAANLYHRRTEAFHDLLCVLLQRENDQITYKEAARKTGLAKRTVRDKVRQLVDDDILHRYRGAVTYVRWASQQAKDVVRELLNKEKTEGDRRAEIEARADERRRRRDEQHSTEPAPQTTNKSGEEDQDTHDTDSWISATKLGSNALIERVKEGTPNREDIFRRRG